MSVGRYQFGMLYGAEMATYNAPYTVNMSDTPVNFTNYWKVLVPADDLQNPDYNGVHTRHAIEMFLLFFYHNIILMCMLMLGKASVKASIASDKDKIKKFFNGVFGPCFAICNACGGASGGDKMGYALPADEMYRLKRQQTTGVSHAASKTVVVEPGKVAPAAASETA